MTSLFARKSLLVAVPLAIAALVLATACEGKNGVTGPQGPQGPQGDRGPAGAAGAPGPQGSAGPAGAAGPQGLRGPDGAQGVAGARGTDGAPGARGAQGDKGAKGDPAVNAGATIVTAPTTVARGASFSITGAGFGSGEGFLAQIILGKNDFRPLSAGTANASGAFVVTGSATANNIPASTPLGLYTIQVIGFDGTQASTYINVVAPPTPTPVPPTPTAPPK